jgi:hypothetical protein
MNNHVTALYISMKSVIAVLDRSSENVVYNAYFPTNSFTHEITFNIVITDNLWSWYFTGKQNTLSGVYLSCALTGDERVKLRLMSSDIFALH